MSLKKLQSELSARFNNESQSSEILTFILMYIQEEQSHYNQLKTSGKITFGKHKGRLISELCESQEGLQYVAWVLDQPWCTPATHTDFITQCNLSGMTPGLSSKYAKTRVHPCK